MLFGDGGRISFNLGGILLRKLVLTHLISIALGFDLVEDLTIWFDLIEVFRVFHIVNYSPHSYRTVNSILRINSADIHVFLNYQNAKKKRSK